MNILRKYQLKKMAQEEAKRAIERELKFLAAAAGTLLIHQLIQKAARVYPKLSFLKIGHD